MSQGRDRFPRGDVQMAVAMFEAGSSHGRSGTQTRNLGTCWN
jgi:hypothetical protein